MRKILAIILTLAMLFTVASCGTTDIEVTTYNTSSPYGSKVRFSTQDRNGTAYDESIFADHTLTMINFWEPWCGPCVNEIPDLARLYNVYKDKGLLIVGVYQEKGMEGDVDNLINKNYVQYPMLRYTSDFDRFYTGSVPTSIFVDSKGKLVDFGYNKTEKGDPCVIGSADYNTWENMIKGYLG